MTILERAEARQHLSALDGLRGFAAVTVVLYHTSLVFPYGVDGIFGRYPALRSDFTDGILALPIKVETCGPQAVILFFVLSGFVLSKAVMGLHYRSYPQFAIKRFFRIWPAFAVAILCSAFLSLVIGHNTIPGGSAWLHEIWSSGGTRGNIWRHLLMTEARVDLDNVMWSLIHELRISFLFPALFLMVRRWPFPTCFAATGLMFVACEVSPMLGDHVVLRSYLETASYVFLFAFGATLGMKLSGEAAFITQSWPLSLAFMALFAGLLICGPKDTAHVSTMTDAFRLLVCGIGATGMIFVAAKSKFEPLFSSRPARYLGRISYSLYLIHVIVLATVLNGLAHRFGIGSSALLTVALMLPLADIYQRLVEAPTDRFGRRVAGLLDRHRASPIRLMPAE